MATNALLPVSAHTSRPWRIHELTPDFEIEDVWALPTPGGADDLPRLVSLLAASEFPAGQSPLVRFLWDVRDRLGRVLHWDDSDSGVGTRVASLRDRLPADLRAAPRGPDGSNLPLSSVFLLADEWAAEGANRTVHGVMHIGWVPDDAGGYRGQLAVLIRTNGRLGKAYMAAIKPFRYLFVYPALLRAIAGAWQAETRREEADG